MSWLVRAADRLSSSVSAAWSLRRSPCVPPAGLLSAELMIDWSQVSGLLGPHHFCSSISQTTDQKYNTKLGQASELHDSLYIIAHIRKTADSVHPLYVFQNKIHQVLCLTPTKTNHSLPYFTMTMAFTMYSADLWLEFRDIHPWQTANVKIILIFYLFQWVYSVGSIYSYSIHLNNL